MKAIRVLDDDERTLSWDDVDDPELGAGQVRVAVKATAVNRADLLQRRGLYPVPAGASPILGLECAGEIAEVGDDVDGWSVGDRVCVLLEGGGYAEQVVVDASMLLPIPGELDFAEAAAIPEVFATAFLNVWLEADCQPREVVLVHAAASGVGTAAVQLCQVFDNPCIATASGPKLERVAELGADITIDRHAQSFRDVIREERGKAGVDVILDPVGGSYLRDNIDVLAKRGRLVLIGLLGGASAEVNLGKVLMKRIRVIGSVLRSRSRSEKVPIINAMQQRVWPHFESGALRPIIHTRLPIADAGVAHELLRSNKTIGKVVLEIP